MNVLDEMAKYGKSTEDVSVDLNSVLHIEDEKLLKPKALMQELDKYVVGQSSAKKKLCVAVYNHYKRAEIKNEDIKKSNILLVGPTGSGKTYLLETLAKIIDVPIVIVDANSYTEAGYIGADVENMVERLLAKTDYDVERAEKGIIFIDEIDKLSSSGSDTERKVGGKGVQQALLKLLEGCEVEAKAISSDSRMGGMESSRKIKVRTHNILFVCGGAFPDMEEIISNRMNAKSSMGFGSDTLAKDGVKDNILMHVETDDLKKFGLIPELLGRLPVVVTLEELTKDILVDILTKPKGCIMGQYRELLKYDCVDLRFTEDALDWVATMALKKGTGARSLRSVMEDILEDVMFEVPTMDDVSSVLVDLRDDTCSIEYGFERYQYAAGGR